MRYMMLIYTKETENGLSPEQAREVMEGHSAVIEQATRKGILLGAEPLAPTSTATSVRLQNGRLQWIERNEGTEVIHDTEPGTTRWQRIVVRILSWLPIDWML